MLWAELRVHGEVGAIETPVGLIPKYEDLVPLFESALGKTYTKTQYDEQFAIRTAAYRAKFARMERIFGALEMPKAFADELKAQIDRLAE